MAQKPTYEKLEQKIWALEKSLGDCTAAEDALKDYTAIHLRIFDSVQIRDEKRRRAGGKGAVQYQENLDAPGFTPTNGLYWSEGSNVVHTL
jgi:hypothetical protein